LPESLAEDEALGSRLEEEHALIAIRAATPAAFT
jgi:hypothetical protein